MGLPLTDGPHLADGGRGPRITLNQPCGTSMACHPLRPMRRLNEDAKERTQTTDPRKKTLSTSIFLRKFFFHQSLRNAHQTNLRAPHTHENRDSRTTSCTDGGSIPVPHVVSSPRGTWQKTELHCVPVSPPNVECRRPLHDLSAVEEQTETLPWPAHSRKPPFLWRNVLPPLQPGRPIGRDPYPM